MKEENIILSHGDLVRLKHISRQEATMMRPRSSATFSKLLEELMGSFIEVDNGEFIFNESQSLYFTREYSYHYVSIEKWTSIKIEAEKLQTKYYSVSDNPAAQRSLAKYTTTIINPFLNLFFTIAQANSYRYIQQSKFKERDSILNDFDIVKRALNNATEKLNDAELTANSLLKELDNAKDEILKFDSKSKSQTIKQTQTLIEEAQQFIEYRLGEAAENARSNLQSLRNELDKKVDQAENKITDLVSKTTRQQNIITSEIKDLFNILEEESTNRVEVRIQRAEVIATELAATANETKLAVEDSLAENKDSLHNFIVENQNKLNNIIRKASTDSSLEIQQAQTNAQQSFDKHVNDNINSIEKRITEKISTYDKLKQKMEETLNEKVEALEAQISIVTSGVMADQHIKQANTERNVYWAFQLLGLFFMMAAIYSGSVFFSEITNIRLPFLPKPDLVIHVDGAIGAGQNPTTLMFMRLSMIILLTAPAIYLLKEAAVHRHKENLYRQRGIQLATISPYLEELEKTERAAIKKELVTSFFQFHDGKADSQNVPDFLRDMKEMVGIAKSINGQQKTVRERLGRK
ncbi:TPA: hypothetical protein KDY47_003281 [Vibrio parahaemolyticus]|nr:hypothetical protein [Vibrio parahaemolyticus]